MRSFDTNGPLRKKDTAIGSILSYAMIILNSLYGLIITPYILGVLGDVEFGVYKTIASLSSSLLVIDLGLGGTAMRYIAKYRAEKRDDKIEKFVSMIFVEGGCLVLAAAAICALLFPNIPAIFKKGLGSDQVGLAQTLFLVLSLNICLHIVENILGGIISGYNLFSVGNTLKFIRIVLRILLTYVILAFFRSSLALVLIDLSLTVILIVCEYIFIRRSLKIRIGLSFKNIDTSLLLESSKYTVFLFLASVAAQVNSNLDNIVIGAQLSAVRVTVYSMAITIFAMFENLSTSVSNVMLPTIADSLANDPSGEKAKDIVVRAGRIQFALLGAALFGFAVLGRQFIKLWLGDGFDDVYLLSLILMSPAILELCVNTCLSILRAKNMLGFRTFVLCVSTAANAIITIVGVRLFGYFAAAVGTAVSFLFGSVIVMNIYYYKKLKINMLKIYLKIFDKILVCNVISAAVTYVASLLLRDGWLSFICNVLIYLAVYALTMTLWGFDKEERYFLKNILQKIGGRIKK